MRTTSKIVLIIVVFIVGVLFITLIGQSTGHTKGGGPLGIVVMIGLIAGIKAIWSYKPDNDPKQEMSADKQSLQKR